MPRGFDKDTPLTRILIGQSPPFINTIRGKRCHFWLFSDIITIRVSFLELTMVMIIFGGLRSFPDPFHPDPLDQAGVRDGGEKIEREESQRER